MTIEDIYKVIGGLKQVFMGIAGQYGSQQHELEDAVQELFLKFLKMNPDTLKDIYKNDGRQGLIRYGAVVLRRDFTSPRSSYYYIYRRYYTLFPASWEYDIRCKNFKETEGTNHTWELYEQMDIELDKLYWYDREIYKLYYSPEGETLDTLAKKTGISRNSLFNTIDNVRKYLKKKLSD